jgi:5-methylcytosine-specific restriction endonuclease McrA
MCAAKITAKRQREREPQAYGDPAWRRLSQEMRAEYPYCFACKSTDDLTVDHVIPLMPGQSPVVPKDQLAVLCRSCHGKKTRHGGGRVRL